MFTKIAGSIGATAIILSLGVIGASTASASETQASPVDGSIGLCFVIPFPGSANLVWCL
ncbi:hypothetical protein [Nocardia nepalensis]|uniref:hypothetical protein n=1 Tax=Nocardia nepalensis TaxID=3375448 RepID=UPI003B66D0CE